MFWRKHFFVKTRLSKKILLSDVLIPHKFFQTKSYSGISACFHNKYTRICFENLICGGQFCQPTSFLLPMHRKSFSSGLLDGETSQLLKTDQDNDNALKKITELFPQPRVTLNELNEKTPKKIFEIHFKQNVVTPKGPKRGKNKVAQVNEWLCTYAFVWPEKIKFDGTAISKRQAAEKAATQALHYLYTNKRIDSAGQPIYNNDVLQELRSKLHEPYQVTISDSSVERLQRISEEYDTAIKAIYEETFKEAKRKIVELPAVFTKDSTLDEDETDPSIESSFMDGDVADLSESKVHIHPVYGKRITPDEGALSRRSSLLQRRFQEYDERITPLPIDQFADQITSTLESSRVVVLVGAAGCGKSTRAPAAILRRGGARTAAIVSEPRRVAAIGLAERVASELGEDVGESIGYQVRLQAQPPRPPGGSVLYCTSGVLLRRLQTNPGLEGCSHVVIDEAHERDVNTDVTLLLLRKALALNPGLRLLVMSATLDAAVFTRYFDSCPVIEVPGRSFPVDVSYLDEIQKKFRINLSNTMENCRRIDGKPQINCQEVVDVIKAVDRTEEEGAILVFLPGWAEIKLSKQLLDETYGETSTHMVLPVHSRLSTTEQSMMFAKPLPGVRKIVLATNIAETSITIPDVVYVVDTGAHKENRTKEGTGTASLETVWVSKAGAKQRTGRAGRVQPGHCYRLYTKEKEAEFAPHTTPEILRIPLESTVLDCKTYAPDDKVENFLSQLLEPPSKKAIQFAVNDLIDLGALTQAEQLTRLGSMLSTLTLHPRLGLALLHASVAGAVLAVANVVTHCADNVELFANAADRREEIREIKRKYSETSDHAALHWIQEEFERKLAQEGWSGVDEWCQRLGLRKDRLKYVKSLSNIHLEQLLKTGIVEPTAEPEEMNRFCGVDELTSALLLSGSNSLLRTRKLVRTKGKLKTIVELVTTRGDRAHVGGESVNHDVTRRAGAGLLAHFGGAHSAARGALLVRHTSRLPPHAALLAAGGAARRETANHGKESTTILNLPKHKLQIHVPTSQADHLLKAREMLHNTFKYYIERDIQNVDYDVNTRIFRFKVKLIKAIGRILVEAGKDDEQVKKLKESFR